jgi:type I restriction enzyme, S subunit
MQPSLRFKEFSDDWQLRAINDIAIKVGSGSTPLGGESAYVSQGIPVIRSQNISNNLLNLGNIRFIPESINSKMSGTTVKPNDILLNITGASIGRSCVVPSNFNIGNVNQHVCIIRLKESENPFFYQPFIASNRGQIMIMSNQVGGAREGLNFQSIRAFEIFTPKLLEQTKIASFLSAVDEKISQLAEKHELLKRYKKGVMQKIFSLEIRFKSDNGSDYSDWVESSLGKIGSISSGTGFPDAEQGGYYGVPFYKVSDMNLESNTQEMKTSNNYVSEKQILKLRLKPITKPAIIFAKVGAAIFLERKRKAQNFLIDNNMMAFIPNFDINFAKHLFDSIRLAKFAQVGALPSYNASDISTIKVSIPSTEEQAKIAGFLSAIDDKIHHTQYQLKATKQYKQGLLQQMFI